MRKQYERMKCARAMALIVGAFYTSNNLLIALAEFCTAKSSSKDDNHALYLAMHIIAQALMGIGWTPFEGIGTAYLDDNISEEQSSTYNSARDCMHAGERKVVQRFSNPWTLSATRPVLPSVQWH